VSLAASSVAVNATTQATAVTRDASNNVLTGRVISWSSSDITVATVDGGGLVTAKKIGTATITATSETKSGSAAVTVVAATAPSGPAAVATVTVSLAGSSIPDNTSTQATAVLRDTGGNVLTGRVVIWSSSQNSIATVDGGGLITAKKVGSSVITATSETKSGSASLIVTP